MAGGVVLLSDMRKVQIGDPVLTIEQDEQLAVRERKVTRHGCGTGTGRVESGVLCDV
jgi:hypothetical protein